jgi:hypothetical protein
MNEAELRTAVVDIWLRDHGFTIDQVKVEKTFSVRLGRNVFEVGSRACTSTLHAKGRADYLVRAHDGRNLLIVETKNPDEALDDASRRQGVSYARLLEDGGIAPFVILTNGRQTEIIDSITGQTLKGCTVPKDHPHVTSGFRVSVDDISYRAEALEQLISLSPDNLLAFCRAQVELRMRKLRSTSLTSGIKYIPDLYVERTTSTDALRDAIQDGKRCILIAGPPQVGKTNFVCHFVEQELAAGTPCLFYPAISIGTGLACALKEDFEWTMGDAAPLAHIIRYKLSRILQHSQKRLLIVVEGLNESQDLIRSLDGDVERLNTPGICVIVSFTTHSAPRILLDGAGNPTYMSRASGICDYGVPLIEFIPEKLPASHDLAVIPIRRFSLDETKDAYRVYSKAFNVTIPPGHQQTNEPLLLRNAMEQFSGLTLPENLDSSEILAKSIDEKLRRMNITQRNGGRVVLEDLARRMCSGEHPVSEISLHQQTELSDRFFESALLCRLGDDNGPSFVDFYYSAERSFIIGYWVRCWPSVLRGTHDEVAIEVSLGAKREVVSEALRWFLRQEANSDVLTSLGHHLPDFDEPASRRLITICLCDYLTQLDRDWFDLTEELQDVARGDEVCDICADIVADETQELDIRGNAAIALGTANPERCIQTFCCMAKSDTPITRHAAVLDALEPGLSRAVDEIREWYYGSMCPGALDGLTEDHALLHEYESVAPSWIPVIRMFRRFKTADRLEDVLRDLNSNHTTIVDIADQSSLFQGSLFEDNKRT